MTTIKGAVGDEHYEQVRSFISWAIPGAEAPNDILIDGVLRAIHRKHGAAAVAAGLPPLPPELLAETEAEAAEKQRLSSAASYPLYIANATHHRVRSMTTHQLGDKSNTPYQSEFVGYLPVVRVPLPEMLHGTEDIKVTTPIGDVHFYSDHIAGSREAIAARFSDVLHYEPARVELVTPARNGTLNRRFGAIAVYLGFKNMDDRTPSFYVLEAGMATGEAKVLYLGKTMDTTIVQRSGYVPTAYSSEHNSYRGHLVVAESEPISMYVQPIPPKEGYYAQITVQYHRVLAASNDPAGLLIEAAERIALIGAQMGVPSGVPLQSVMAGLARGRPWVHEPAFGGPGVIQGSE